MSRCLVVSTTLVVAVFIVSAPCVALDWPGYGVGLSAAWDGATSNDRADMLAGVASADDPVILELLLNAAGSPDAVVRAEAARAIGRAEIWSLEPVLVDLLTDRRPDVRIAASEALGALGTPGSVEPLVRARGDADADVRVAVIEALGRLGDPDATLAVVDALNDPDRDVVVAALVAIGALGHRGALYAVLEKLHDPMREVAAAAAGVVADLRAIEGVPALVELVESGVPDVAIAAIEALGALRSRAATPTLVTQVLSPRVEGARVAALDALVASGDPAAIVLVDEMDRLSELDLAPLVAAIGAEAAGPLAERFARSGGIESRAERLLRLWLVTGDPRAVDVLGTAWDTGALVSDGDARIEWLTHSPTARAWCLRVEWSGIPTDDDEWFALLDGADAPGAADCLVEALEDVDALSPSVAVRIVEVLASVGRPEAAHIAERFVDVDRLDAADGLALVLALRALGADGVVGLRRVLTSRRAWLRRDAANALADRTTPWVEAGELDSLIAWQTVRVDVMLALDGQGAVPGVAERVAAATGSSALDLRTAARAIAPCEAVDQDPLALDRGDDVPLLYRREAWRVSFSCGLVDASSVSADEIDASVRAMALAATGTASSLEDLATRDERLVAITTSNDADRLARYTRGRDAVLAAAAVLRLSRLEPSTSRLAWLRGASADVPVLRAAWFASAPDDPGAREWALRRETHPGVRAVLQSGEPLSAPVIVSAVDAETDAPRPNELVVGITVEGDLVFGRTDVFGRARWDRTDLRAVFVAGAAQ